MNIVKWKPFSFFNIEKIRQRCHPPAPNSIPLSGEERADLTLVWRSPRLNYIQLIQRVVKTSWNLHPHVPLTTPSCSGADLLASLTSTFDQKMRSLTEGRAEEASGETTPDSEQSLFRDPSLHRAPTQDAAEAQVRQRPNWYLQTRTWVKQYRYSQVLKWELKISSCDLNYYLGIIKTKQTSLKFIKISSKSSKSRLQYWAFYIFYWQNVDAIP